MSCTCNTKGNQFYYTRKEIKQPEYGDTEVKFEEFTDSMNLQYVVRSIGLDNGERVVILDDFKEFSQEVELKSNKGNSKGVGTRRKSAQSEIYLNKEDAEKFVKLTNIE